MRAIARAFWLVVQLAWSVPAFVWLWLTRRGCPLVLTHHQDRDARGRDRQMGPLLDALGRRCLEVARVPLSAAVVMRGGAPWLPYAALIAAARLLAPLTRDRARIVAARTRVARWLVRALRPPVLFLIDESGSGQPLVRAARAFGVRTVGIQHGDFAPGSALYDRERAREVVAADVLCTWSAWFQARLFAISGAYTLANTRVTGRLRATEPPPEQRATLRRVLVLGEADPAFAAAVAPFVTALRGEGFEVEVQPHPAVTTAPRDLAAALAWCDVALGMRSSALLEALWYTRPIVVVADAAHAWDGLVASGLAAGCPDPAHVVTACRAAFADRAQLDRARELVWGGAPVDTVGAVLDAARMTGLAAPRSTL